MRYEAKTIEEYFAQVPEERIPAFIKLWQTIQDNIPEGFEAQMNYGFPSFAVPHSIYPAGYHCDPKVALPFLSIASQKNFIALYHSGIYADPTLLKWFMDNYPKHSEAKLDMGKSCVRFKKPDQIPFDLIAELVAQMTVEEWIRIYETNLKTR